MRIESSFFRRACLWRNGIVGAIGMFCLLGRPIQGTWQAAPTEVSDPTLAASGNFRARVGAPFACAYPQQGGPGAAVAADSYSLDADITPVRSIVDPFSYDAKGNAKPRILAVPHGSWGLSLSRPRNEIAVSVEHENAVYIYRRAAEGYEPPLRVIRGPST